MSRSLRNKKWEDEFNDKIKYYLRLFYEKGITAETVKEYLDDKSFCCYVNMPCMICSRGCFKINIRWELEKILDETQMKLFRKLECELLVDTNGKLANNE